MARQEEDAFIERRILTGMIVSTEYMLRIHSSWDSRLLESATARLLAGWCMDYFTKYGKAPNRDIEGIYTQKLKDGLDKERAGWIEDILQSLSDDYDRGQFNVDYLHDQTKLYFKERHLDNFTNDIRAELTSGNITEAERLAMEYTNVADASGDHIDPFDKGAWREVKDAFAEREKPLIRFGKALGEFWNNEFARDSFLGIMGPEKVGKTFTLIGIAMKSLYRGCNVAFFQAGDMTKKQFLRRIGIHLAGRSDQERYCNNLYLPKPDCLLNQTDACSNDLRECNFGVFDNEDLAKQADFEKLKELTAEHPDYIPCTSTKCQRMRGAIWLQKQRDMNPLTWKEAWKAYKKFRKRWSPRFRLSTYPSDTLTMAEITSTLGLWEREGFVPDVILIDYADLLAPDPDITRLDYRNQQNKIWQRMRSLSQSRHCLLVTATQAAASSYEHDLLRLSDFSEDKRKYAHVTAMYGLNQTDEEKRIGVLRVNELVVREADFDKRRPVHVLQRLQMGKPMLGSYW